MRTTITLDDEIARETQEEARRRKTSFKKTINDLLRLGLLASRRPASRKREVRIPTFRSAFRTGIDPMRLNQLNDELEVEDFVSEHERG